MIYETNLIAINPVVGQELINGMFRLMDGEYLEPDSFNNYESIELY